MADDPILLAYQGVLNAPTPDTLTSVTDAINSPKAFADQISNFDPEVYDVSAESHLAKFLKVLLGDAGVGQLRKRMLLSRFEASLLTTKFLDLDRYGGVLFGFHRMADETLWVTPDQTATPTEWDEASARDVKYLNRLQQFLRALPLGTSYKGVQMIASAILAVDCDVFETYAALDEIQNTPAAPAVPRTYGDVEATFVTYRAMEDQVYDFIALAQGSFGTMFSENRNDFVIRPKRTLTDAETFEVYRVLNRLKPAGARLIVDSEGSDVHDSITVAKARADSVYWEVTTKVAPKVGTEKFYVQQSAAGEAVEQPRPAFSRYQGEAWSYINDVASVSSYSLDDSDVTSTPNFEQIRLNDGQIHDYPANAALMTQREIMSGRAVSDAILAAVPYPNSRQPVTYAGT